MPLNSDLGVGKLAPVVQAFGALVADELFDEKTGDMMLLVMMFSIIMNIAVTNRKVHILLAKLLLLYFTVYLRKHI